MTHLEKLISRHLDGELDSVEEYELTQTLRTSFEARVLLQEMMLVRSAARISPSLHTPSAQSERRLLSVLRGEGYSGGLSRRTPVTASRSAFSPKAEIPAEHNQGLRRYGVLALLFTMMLVGGGYWFADTDLSDSPIATASTSGADGSIADVPQTIERGVGTNPTPMVIPNYAAGTPAVRRRSNVASNNLSSSSRPSNRSGRSIQPPAYAHINIPPLSVDTNRPSVPSVAALGHNDIVPNELQNRELLNQDAAPLLLAESLSLSMPREPREVSGIVASLQGGMSQISRGEGITTSDMQIRLGYQFSQADRVTMILGTTADVTEFRHENTGRSLSLPPGGTGGPRRIMLDAPPPERRIEIREQVWMGVAYHREIAEVAGVRLNVGLSAGSSSTALRVGGEITIEKPITRNVTLLIGSVVQQTLPYDNEAEQFIVFNSPDSYVYNGAVQRPGFYSLGLQAGVRVTLGD